jgi:hypothetical protein
VARPLDCLIGLGLNPSPYDEAMAEAKALRDAIAKHNALVEEMYGKHAFWHIDVSHIPENP